MKGARILLMALAVGLMVAGCSQTDPLTPRDESRTIPNNKDGTEMLGEIAISAGSGFAEGGVGMVDTDSGILDITVPAGASVEQVLLYWMGGATTDVGDDTIEVDGNPVTGTLIGGPTNFFWDYDFYAYRADVTAEGWVVPGANSFTITGLDFDYSGRDLDENNGVGMIVVYDDGTEAELELHDGLDMAFFKFSPTLDSTAPITFDFAAEDADRTARFVVLAGSVGENRPNMIKITTSAGEQVFDDPLGSGDGLLFDSITLDVLIPAGETMLTAQLFSVVSEDPLGASLGWIGTGLAVPVTPPPLLCLGDYVWFDENRDGCQDAGEMGAADVEVNLWVGCPPAEIIATTTTDADGMYMFCDLEPGDYTVQFVAPDGYEFCEQYAAGCGPEGDSNAGSDGITDCVTLVDQDDLTIDAGLCEPPVEEGCSFTIGYWKTHAGFGPQADVVTPLLPVTLGDAGGAKSLEVADAGMAVDVLSQHVYGNPGNGITKLYAQMLGAKLNVANGAGDGDIAEALAEADAFLAEHDHTDWRDITKSEQMMVLDWKSTFDSYNNGLIGPGHCDGNDAVEYD